VTDEEVFAFLDHSDRHLSDPQNRAAFAYTTHFRARLPQHGGVYVFFLNDEVVYVGETKSLRQRLGNHMRNPENHVLALKIARLLFDILNGPGAAGSRRAFAEDHKQLTRDWVARSLQVAWLPVQLGRKELEEFLIEAYDPEFNKRYPTVLMGPIANQEAV